MDRLVRRVGRAGVSAGVDVAFVSGEPLWPPHHGGRIRGARVVEELCRRLRVLTVAPVQAPPPCGVRVEALPDEVPGGRVATVASARPRLGRTLLGPRRLTVLQAVLARERPAVVLFASSYMAAATPAVDIPVAVDFVDVEIRRMRSFSRLAGVGVRSRTAARLEYVKARRWEPALARRAALASSPSAEDVGLLASWGAPAVHVPNGADRREITHSPVDGPVTFVASFGYRPNQAAAEFVLREIWPLLRQAEPELRLRLVGRDAARVVGPVAPPAVEIVSDPEEVDDVYRQASVVLAPVSAGGGSQLKVTEALSRGRTVVATSFSARAAPSAAAGAVLVADDPRRFAAHVVALWSDTAARRAAEKALLDTRPVPTWEEACAPLADGLERIVHRR